MLDILPGAEETETSNTKKNTVLTELIESSFLAQWFSQGSSLPSNLSICREP